MAARKSFSVLLGRSAVDALGVNEWDRLIAIAAINEEVAQIGRDDFCPWKSLRELQDPAVGHVHCWPVFRYGGSNRIGIAREDRLDHHPAFSRQCENEVNGALGVGEEVARLGQHYLTSGRRLAQGIQDFARPQMMLIGRVSEGDQRTGIEDVARISHARNLRVAKGRSVHS